MGSGPRGWFPPLASRVTRSAHRPLGHTPPRGGPLALGLTFSRRRAVLQVVPGVLNTDVFKLGRVVDAKSHQDDIPSGSQLNLPLWLVESLATMVLEATPAGGRSARFFVDVQAPNAFSPVAVEDMHADAGAARVRSSTRYYYDVGMKLGALGRLQGNEELMQIVEADTEGEGSFLVKVFKARFCSLLAEAHIVPEDTRMKMQKQEYGIIHPMQISLISL